MELEGKLITGENNTDEGKVYLVENGLKRWIVSPEIFEKLKFKCYDIKKIPYTELSAIPSGNLIDKKTFKSKYELQVDKTIKELHEYGERVSHLYKNNCYFAHLSLYYLATQFIKGNKILDAGSGCGYGTAYLADINRDYEVIGLEISEKAVEFSKKTFVRSNLTYKQMDLEHITGFTEDYFDFIYCSNVMEHIENTQDFLSCLCEILKPDGLLLIIVPIIICKIQRDDNIGISQHLNIWSPRQWKYVLNKYFRQILCYTHINRSGIDIGDFNNTPEETTITEKDFILKEVELEELYKSPSFGAVFLCKYPKKSKEIVKITFLDDSFTRPRPVVAQCNCLSHLNEIYGHTKIIQTFITDRELCQIDILFATFNRTNNKDIIFHLKNDLNNKETLVTKKINASCIKDNSWVQFTFNPVKSNITNKYYIIIESPEATPGNTVTIRTSDIKCFQLGELYYNDSLMDFDIAFKVFDKISVEEHIINTRYNNSKHEGHFVQGETDVKIYLIECSEKRLVTSPDILKNLAIKTDDIINISDKELQFIPEGKPFGIDCNMIRYKLSKEFLKGRGLEIGAGAYPQQIPEGVFCEYFDKKNENERDIKKTYSLKAFRERFPHGADFLIAHNVLEHTSNPIKTLIEWNDYVKPGGNVVISVPHVNYCPDKGRLIPSFEHILLDYLLDRDDNSFESREHIYSFIMGWIDEGFAKDKDKFYIAQKAHECAKAKENDLHWHAFDEDLFEKVVKASALFGNKNIIIECTAMPGHSDKKYNTTGEIICIYCINNKTCNNDLFKDLYKEIYDIKIKLTKVLDNLILFH